MIQLLEKYRNILTYLLCSIFTALIEMGIGWNLLQIIPNIILTNTLAILISSVIHYFITLKFVFGQKNSIGNATIYVGTFVFGIILQDFVIAICYNYILADIEEFIRYATSKVVSLVLPFVVTYLLRCFLYKKYNSKKDGVAE